MQKTAVQTTNIHCKNCGEALNGAYCSACGQKHVPMRLNLKDLLAGAFLAITDLDSKIWRTVLELTRNPGQVALNYIGGQRFSYVNPIKYFVVTFAIMFGVIALTIGLDAMVEEMVHVSADTDPNDKAVEIADAVKAVIRDHYNIAAFLTLPLLAFFVRWQFWRSGHNYVETLSFLAFVSGQANLYGLLLTLILFVFGSAEQGLSTFVGFAVLMQGAKVFFRLSWGKLVIAMVFTALLQTIASGVVGSALVFAKMKGLF